MDICGGWVDGWRRYLIGRSYFGLMRTTSVGGLTKRELEIGVPIVAIDAGFLMEHLPVLREYVIFRARVLMATCLSWHFGKLLSMT
jgi:hypothetical protein